MGISHTWYDTLVDDSGSGLDGTPWNRAAVLSLLTAIDARVQDWVAVPYNGANFFASGAMTWTVDAGDVIVNRYARIGNVIVWTVQIAASSIGGTPATQLYINAPSGIAFSSTGNYSRGVFPEIYAAPITSSILSLQLINGGAFPASTNGTYVYFTFVGEVA